MLSIGGPHPLNSEQATSILSPEPDRQPGRPGMVAGLALAMLIGAAVAVSLCTFNYAEGLAYLSNNPTACINCHVMRENFDGWLKGSHHAAATCNDCHTPVEFFPKYYVKTEHGIRHSKGFTFQDFHEPIQIKDSSLAVVEKNCVRCHTALVSDISAHEGLREPTSCVHCHQSAGHGPRK